MPLYSYECPEHGTFTAWQSMSRSDRSARCPDCRQAVPRSITAPALNTLSSSERQAHYRNEKSADSPDVVQVVGKKHDHGGHPHHHHHGRKGTVGRLGGGSLSRRPWMIGH
jgi:putative FmdB family regulatory protein